MPKVLPLQMLFAAAIALAQPWLASDAAAVGKSRNMRSTRDDDIAQLSDAQRRAKWKFDIIGDAPTDYSKMRMIFTNASSLSALQFQNYVYRMTLRFSLKGLGASEDELRLTMALNARAAQELAERNQHDIRIEFRWITSDESPFTIETVILDNDPKAASVNE